MGLESVIDEEKRGEDVLENRDEPREEDALKRPPCPLEPRPLELRPRPGEED